MIIKHVNEVSISEQTDTDKLGDVSATILEAAEALKVMCTKYQRQCIITINTDDSPSGRMFMFYNFISEHMSPPTEEGIRPPLQETETKPFFAMLNRAVHAISQGRMMVVNNPDHIPPENKNEE